MALDADGNLYIAAFGGGEDQSVRQVDAAGVIRTVVGIGFIGFNGDGLTGPLTALDQPIGVAVDPCGNLMISEQGSQRVRRLDLRGACQPAGGSRAELPRSAAAGRRWWPAVAGFASAASACTLFVALVRRRSHPRTARHYPLPAGEPPSQPAEPHDDIEKGRTR